MHGHAKGRRATRKAVGERRSTLEDLGVTSVFWRDRPTLVTGATGLLGSWLVQRLEKAGADVVCLVRDWVPQSGEQVVRRPDFASLRQNLRLAGCGHALREFLRWRRS